MCMLIHVQVPRDINHKPCASSCLQRDRFLPLSQHDTLHVNARRRARSPVESDSVIPDYRCGCCQQPQQLKVSRAVRLFYWIKWEVGEADRNGTEARVCFWLFSDCQLTWLQHTHVLAGKVQNGFPPPWSQPSKFCKLSFVAEKKQVQFRTLEAPFTF